MGHGCGDDAGQCCNGKFCGMRCAGGQVKVKEAKDISLKSTSNNNRTVKWLTAVIWESALLAPPTSPRHTPRLRETVINGPESHTQQMGRLETKLFPLPHTDDFYPVKWFSPHKYTPEGESKATLGDPFTLDWAHKTSQSVCKWQISGSFKGSLSYCIWLSCLSHLNNGCYH